MGADHHWSTVMLSDVPPTHCVKCLKLSFKINLSIAQVIHVRFFTFSVVGAVEFYNWFFDFRSCIWSQLYFSKLSNISRLSRLAAIVCDHQLSQPKRPNLFGLKKIPYLCSLWSGKTTGQEHHEWKSELQTAVNIIYILALATAKLLKPLLSSRPSSGPVPLSPATCCNTVIPGTPQLYLLKTMRINAHTQQWRAVRGGRHGLTCMLFFRRSGTWTLFISQVGRKKQHILINIK